ncbi:MAG: FKBP-type peptidyl-prolyl cis-trans isomerase [Candidatus Nanoarchaeia archaeon]
MENNEKIVEKDKFVILDYEGRLEDGSVFDSSNREGGACPLTFQAGSGMVIPGFDKAVMGMKIGQEKEFEIEPEDAYGAHDPSLRQEIPKNAIKMDRDPEAGMVLMMQTPNGQQVPLPIVEVKGDVLVVDMNHPLAGKKLIFKIKVVDIKDESEMPKHECHCKSGSSCGEDCECGDDCNCEGDCKDECECEK